MGISLATYKGQSKSTALANSSGSASIISWDLAKKLKIIIFEKGDAILKDASNKHMDVRGREEIMVELGLPHKIKVLISNTWAKTSWWLFLEDLKNIGILHLHF